jgi:hypothetical protein
VTLAIGMLRVFDVTDKAVLTPKSLPISNHYVELE